MTEKTLDTLLAEVKTENTEADAKAFELFCKEELRKQLSHVDKARKSLDLAEEALGKLMEEGTMRKNFDGISNNNEKSKITRSILDDVYTNMYLTHNSSNLNSIMNMRSYT